MLLVYYYKTNSINLIFGSLEKIRITKKQKMFIDEINIKSEELGVLSKNVIEENKCVDAKELFDKASKDKELNEKVSIFSNKYKKQVTEIIKLVTEFNEKYCEGYDSKIQSKNGNL